MEFLGKCSHKTSIHCSHLVVVVFKSKQIRTLNFFCCCKEAKFLLIPAAKDVPSTLEDIKYTRKLFICQQPSCPDVYVQSLPTSEKVEEKDLDMWSDLLLGTHHYPQGARMSYIIHDSDQEMSHTHLSVRKKSGQKGFNSTTESESAIPYLSFIFIFYRSCRLAVSLSFIVCM